jgi:cell wall-associated NlpC family hydrolase
VPWTILAGIGTVESDNGRSNLPGVHSGQNGFGAAGPMQIGIGGASTNTWGGAPIHPASEMVAGVATDEDHTGVANVYDPADAIAGAAKYLIAHGVQTDPSSAVFSYNHLTSYVTDVEMYASDYASGGFTVSQVNPDGGAGTGSQSCTSGSGMLTAMTAPNALAETAIGFAEQQIGKPYLWGATGPDSFDCSGLVMMAYRAAGISIARTSQQQWATEQRIPAAEAEPGDLVFFAGSDGTPTAPGHVGLVIGKNTMIEAYATGFPVRVSQFGTGNSAAGDGAVVGFTRPWAGAAGTMPGSTVPGSASSTAGLPPATEPPSTGTPAP